MNKHQQVAKQGDRQFFLSSDRPELGWYLHVYEGGISIHDSLQDTEQLAKEEAKENWGIELDAWKNDQERVDL